MSNEDHDVLRSESILSVIEVRTTRNEFRAISSGRDANIARNSRAASARRATIDAQLATILSGNGA